MWVCSALSAVEGFDDLPIVLMHDIAGSPRLYHLDLAPLLPGNVRNGMQAVDRLANSGFQP